MHATVILFAYVYRSYTYLCNVTQRCDINGLLFLIVIVATVTILNNKSCVSHMCNETQNTFRMKLVTTVTKLMFSPLIAFTCKSVLLVVWLGINTLTDSSVAYTPLYFGGFLVAYIRGVHGRPSALVCKYSIFRGISDFGLIISPNPAYIQHC